MHWLPWILIPCGVREYVISVVSITPPVVANGYYARKREPLTYPRTLAVRLSQFSGSRKELCGSRWCDGGVRRPGCGAQAV
jgi:hypothetical protein